MSFSMPLLLVAPFQKKSVVKVNPPAAATAELLRSVLLVVCMPPTAVARESVPAAAPGGRTVVERDGCFATVDETIPLFPAELRSVTGVPVPPQEAGKLYCNTGVTAARDESAVLIANANAVTTRRRV